MFVVNPPFFYFVKLAMYFLIFLVLVHFAQKSHATEVCIATTPCKCVMNGGQVIDLTSVGTISHPRFSEVADENMHLYSYNPCYPFDSPDKYTQLIKGNTACINAAGCRKTPGSRSGGAAEEHAIGLQDLYKFDFVNGTVFINYTVPNNKQSLSVQLVCENSTEGELEITQPESDDNNHHTILTLKSKCACINGCGSQVNPDNKTLGLSTGSKLLIAFFTILLGYFIIGMIYNSCNGARGVELVPNLDFWNEFPKLIIEGIAFSFSICGKKRSYGEV